MLLDSRRIMNDAMWKNTIGFFDHADSIFNQADDRQSNYPPCNIVKYGDGTYEIELAVAGFKRDELEVKYECSRLIISGKKVDDKNGHEKTYQKKGISSKSFSTVFTIDSSVKVNSVSFIDGILTVTLGIISEDKKPKVFEIK